MNDAGLVELQSIIQVAKNTLDRAIQNRTTLEKASGMLLEALNGTPYIPKLDARPRIVYVEANKCSLCAYDLWRHDTDLRCIESAGDCSVCNDDCECRDCGEERSHFKLASKYHTYTSCPLCHAQIVASTRGSAVPARYCPNCGAMLRTMKGMDNDVSKNN